MSSLHSVMKLVESNNTKGLAKYLKTHKLSPSELQKGMRYSAKMGDDLGLQVWFMNGAKATSAAVRDAVRVSKVKGIGGHSFAGAYIKAVMKKRVSPKTRMSKLKIVQ